MSPLTAAGTLIKQSEPVLPENLTGKYYYINASEGKLVFILSRAVRQYIFTLRARRYYDESINHSSTLRLHTFSPRL